MPPKSGFLLEFTVQNKASEWLWLKTQETPQHGQDVHGFQVRTPSCHSVPVSRAYYPPPGTLIFRSLLFWISLLFSKSKEFPCFFEAFSLLSQGFLSTIDFQSEVGEVFGEIGGELQAKFGRRLSSFLCCENRQKHFPPQISPSNFTTRFWVVVGPSFSLLSQGF